MYLEVEINGTPPVRLIEPQDFKAFKVVAAEDAGEVELAAALADCAEVLADGDVMVRIEGLKELSGELADDPDWLAELEGMIGYAGSKGWLSEDGSAIRAHCERRPAA